MKSRGYSLLELSIWIALIGLVVAGVSTSSSLIKRSKLLDIQQNIAVYQNGIAVFYDRFGYLPGDFPRASDYWPECVAAYGTRCDGNGDKKWTSDGLYEGTSAKTHMLLSGSLDAIPEFPSLSGNRSCSLLRTGNHSSYGTLNKKNLIRVNTTDGTHCRVGIIAAEDAHSIDTKIDDGARATGNMTGSNGYPYDGCKGTELSGYQSGPMEDTGCQLNFGILVKR